MGQFVKRLSLFLRRQETTFLKEKTDTTFTFSIDDVIISSEGVGVIQPDESIFELETGNFLLFENGSGVLLLEA